MTKISGEEAMKLLILFTFYVSGLAILFREYQSEAQLAPLKRNDTIRFFIKF